MGRPRKTERNNDVIWTRANRPEMTLGQIGRFYGISKQRVSKIIKDYGTPDLVIIDYATIPRKALASVWGRLKEILGGMLEGLN